MNLFKQIENDIQSKKFSPIYLLMGEEEFYINKITSLIINNSISESEKEFNLNILYGKDTSVDEIISICKKFPLMSKFQLVVIKEAQDLSRTIDQLTSYTNNFLESTILIINYKHKTLDKRKSLYKSIAKNGTVLESKKLYDNQVQQWINQYLSDKNIKASNKAVAMIVDYLGSDLNKIANELNKLIQLKKDKKEISDIDIEKYIGISKEYNNFELRKAISEKNTFKAFQIADYFSKNSNSNPLVVTISMVFDFFSKLLLYHANDSIPDSKKAIILKINPFFISEYNRASKNYSIKKVTEVISIIREYDLKSKGSGAKNITHLDLLKEMISRIVS
ncbi:MAG: DNA polymerase III subunit delta [Flavobacteriales bacterium]|jgi:DNA polymerase-3 subunit delta|nr:DNA polymerase III subunit delta [Flavobacteriaceae bacterium]RZP06273.1 MAG: DNA polymerase III subunit delta [Flavobacteriales bacterium]